MQQQAVKGNGFGLEGVELDLSELAFLDFAPAVDAGLGLLSFAAVQAAQKFVGVVAGSGLTVRGTRESFDRVAAKKLAPVVIEKIAGGEDVAPGDFAAVSHDDSHNSFILQAGSGLREATLYFAHEIIDGDSHGLRLVDFFVGFGTPITSNRSLEAVRGYLWPWSCGGWLGCSAAANCIPHLGLLLIDRRSFADAGMDDRPSGGELRTAGPSAVLDAEDIERERGRADRNDAVLADDAVLFAAADEFAREQQERALAAIDKNKLVDGSAGWLRKVNGAAVARALHDLRALLGDSHLAGSESFFEGKEWAGVLALRTDDGKDGDVLVGNGIEEPPFALRTRALSGRRTRR